MCDGGRSLFCRSVIFAMPLLRRVLRNRNGSPSVLPSQNECHTDCLRDYRPRSKPPCLGAKSLSELAEEAALNNAKCLKRMTASAINPRHQARRRLFRKCDFMPRIFFSNDCAGSIQDRACRSSCCAGSVFSGIKPRSVSWCAGGYSNSREQLLTCQHWPHSGSGARTPKQ